MGVNAMGARYFRRTDGIIGVGFFIDFAGLRQASISWPDRVSSRHTEDEFERGVIEDITDSVVGKSLVVDQEVDERGIQVAQSFNDWLQSVRDAGGDAWDGVDVESVLTELRGRVEQPVESDPVPPENVGEPKESSEIVADEPQIEADSVGPSVEPPLDVPEPAPKKSEAESIREYITANPEASNAQVIEHLATVSVEVTSSQVAYQRKKLGKE